MKALTAFKSKQDASNLLFEKFIKEREVSIERDQGTLKGEKEARSDLDNHAFTFFKDLNADLTGYEECKQELQQTVLTHEGYKEVFAIATQFCSTPELSSQRTLAPISQKESKEIAIVTTPQNVHIGRIKAAATLLASVATTAYGAYIDNEDLVKMGLKIGDKGVGFTVDQYNLENPQNQLKPEDVEKGIKKIQTTTGIADIDAAAKLLMEKSQSLRGKASEGEITEVKTEVKLLADKK
jgi:hypothetical protein